MGSQGGKKRCKRHYKTRYTTSTFQMSFFKSRVALTPGLGGVSHLPFSLMNRLNKTGPAVFIIWMLYFESIPKSDNLEITTFVVVSSGGSKRSPRTSTECCNIYTFWSFGTVGSQPFLERSSAHPEARRRERCRICHQLS